MKEIVDKILQEEQAARQRLEASRKAAESMLLEAKKDSQDIIQRSLREATETAAGRKAAAWEQMAREKKESLDKTRIEVGNKSEALKKDIPAASRKIFLQVVDIQD